MFHAFGARRHDYLRTEYRQGVIYFHIQLKPHKRRCVSCGSRQVTLHGTERQTLRTLPIGSRPVFLVLHLHDLCCKKCGVIRQEDRVVAAPKKRYTKAFARFVLGLCKVMTISDVARHLGMGWHTVKGIFKEHLEKRAARRSWRKVRRIAIDEIAIRKGHSYMTVVVDLTTGELLFAAEGCDHTCLIPFFRRLRRAGAELDAIAVDMSPAYLKAIRLFGPNGVRVVHDKYHLVAAMNRTIDAVRRSEQNRQEEEGKRFIKGSRYLLLYGKEKLAAKPERKERLDRLLEANEVLNKAYLLKEDLRLFWSQGSREEAETFIEDWLKQARAVNNRPLAAFADTVQRHLGGILAWYQYPISTGPLEGLNNKIKVLKRTAYGYRDTHFFGLRLLFIHEAQFKLAGV